MQSRREACRPRERQAITCRARQQDVGIVLRAIVPPDFVVLNSSVPMVSRSVPVDRNEGYGRSVLPQIQRLCRNSGCYDGDIRRASWPFSS